MALSADRVLGGWHFHLAAAHAAVRHTADLDGHRYAPEIFDATGATALEHADLQQHDHEVGVSGVVHVADDGNTPSQNSHARLTRSIHDLDLLIPSLDIPLAAESASAWVVAWSRRFESHVSTPLERPPQV